LVQNVCIESFLSGHRFRLPRPSHNNYKSRGLIQRVSSTAQGHTPKGGTIPVDTDWMREEAGAAFQVERTKPQTPRATPPP
jgi:hypothetical protein